MSAPARSPSPYTSDGSVRIWLATNQGLTLVHFSAQLKRMLWDRCAIRGCLGGVYDVSGGIQEYQGVFVVILCQKWLRLSCKTDE